MLMDLICLVKYLAFFDFCYLFLRLHVSSFTYLVYFVIQLNYGKYGYRDLFNYFMMDYLVRHDIRRADLLTSVLFNKNL